MSGGAGNDTFEADLAMIEAFNALIKPLEWQIEKIACQHDHNSLYLLRTIPGAGAGSWP